MDMKALSPKQQRIITFINRFLRKNGFPPSVRDIQAGCEISSTSVVDYNLRILEQRGYLRRHAEVSRGIELTGFSANGTLVPVPVVGQIAAGEPIPVPTNDTWDVSTGAEIISVPGELIGNREEVYALRVKGMSMIDALINDGDIVLMQAASIVDNGETAAVWLEAEKEVTLKKYYLEADRVRLQPANETMAPIYVTPGNVVIQGRVIGVIRQLV